jgi:hypothetical protein
MGIRASIRSGTELSALATHSRATREFVERIGSDGLTGALTERDTPFGDYRTSDSES